MSENSEERVNNSFDEILGKDVVNKLVENIGVDLTEKQIKDLQKEAEGSVDFLKAIENIEIPSENYIVFTDGDEQLLYENGEFFVISTKDNPIRRKKKTKKEATEMYLNYFITYQLNGLLGETKVKPTQEVEKKKTRTVKQVQKEEVAKEEKIVIEQEKEEQVVNRQQSVDKDLER